MAGVGTAVVVTENVCVAVVFVLGSVAVTMIVDDSFGWAPEASMWTTPLGLVLVMLALLIRIGLMGFEFSLLSSALGWFITWVILGTTPLGSATSWAKIVWWKSRLWGWPVVMKNWVLLVSGPALAIANWFVPVNASCGLNSSINGVGGKPDWQGGASRGGVAGCPSLDDEIIGEVLAREVADDPEELTL